MGTSRSYVDISFADEVEGRQICMRHIQFWIWVKYVCCQKKKIINNHSINRKIWNFEDVSRILQPVLHAFYIYLQKLELIKALKVRNKEFTIELHGFRDRV